MEWGAARHDANALKEKSAKRFCSNAFFITHPAALAGTHTLLIHFYGLALRWPLNSFVIFALRIRDLEFGLCAAYLR